MSKPSAILDTGPLVALLYARDSYHEWVKAQFQQFPAPFVTCEPVLVEAAFLLAKLPGGTKAFFDFLGSGILLNGLSVLEEETALRKLALKYVNIPMSLADACLVRLSEKFPLLPVLTVDSDFRIYRRNGRQHVPVIIP